VVRYVSRGPLVGTRGVLRLFVLRGQQTKTDEMHSPLKLAAERAAVHFRVGRSTMAYAQPHWHHQKRQMLTLVLSVTVVDLGTSAFELVVIHGYLPPIQGRSCVGSSTISWTSVDPTLPLLQVLTSGSYALRQCLAIFTRLPSRPSVYLYRSHGLLRCFHSGL